MSYSGKVVFITGAAGFLGKKAVEAFSKEGATVVLADVNRESLEIAAEELHLEEGNYLLLPANVANEEEVEQSILKIVSEYGKIDVFLNNAGVVGTVAPLDGYPTEMFDFIMNVNLKGVFLRLKHVLRVIKKQKFGSIINTASGGALKGSPSTAPYAASKSAVVSLTKSAALEVAKLGIRVNAVCPAPINSPMMESLSEEVRNHLISEIPMGRMAETEDVTNLFTFLGSDKALFLTGGIYVVDGGFTAI